MADRLFYQHRWQEARYFSVEIANGCNEPSAPEGSECELCGSEIVGGICSFCDAVYIDGKRVPGKRHPMPFTDEREVTN